MGVAWPKHIKAKFKAETLRLRKLGRTFREIDKELGISKSFYLAYEDKEFATDIVARVLALREEAQSYREIGEKLGVSETTVRTVWLRADDERQKAITSRIASKTGKAGAEARWGGSEEERQASVLQMRESQQRTIAKRAKVVEPAVKEQGPLRAYGYVRVSTEEQSKEGISLAVQEQRIRSYADAKEWELVKIVGDPGYSGKNTKRPGLQEILAHCQSDGLDIVIIYKLDRLSRRVRDLYEIVEDVLVPNNIGLASITESLDTSTPTGRAFFGFTALMAQLERERIGERVSDARMFRDEQGEWTGRQPHGYTLAYDAEGKRVKGKLTTVPAQLQMYKRARELWESGAGVRAVAKRLKVNYGLANRLVHTDVKKLKKRMRKYLHVPNEKEANH